MPEQEMRKSMRTGRMITAEVAHVDHVDHECAQPRGGTRHPGYRYPCPCGRTWQVSAGGLWRAVVHGPR